MGAHRLCLCTLLSLGDHLRMVVGHRAVIFADIMTDGVPAPGWVFAPTK